MLHKLDAQIGFRVQMDYPVPIAPPNMSFLPENVSPTASYVDALRENDVFHTGIK